MLIYRRQDVQLFGFGPDQRSRQQALGVALRVRGRGRWRHLSVHVYWPRRDLHRSRGTVSFEAATWLTGPGTTGERLTFKTFIRIKLGLGGRR
jgi:hypothetical protein